MPLGSRVIFAFVAFFRILFDGAFARRVEQQGEPAALPPAPEPDQQPPPSPAPSKDDAAALGLLALLQREGRLVDFVQQDIESFGDADVGAAARAVHAGCRRALSDHMTLEPVRPESEGSAVTVEAPLDPARVKLTGNVGGSAPYRGTLRHRGWRATDVHLPERVEGHDASVLAPAEVEL